MAQSWIFRRFLKYYIVEYTIGFVFLKHFNQRILEVEIWINFNVCSRFVNSFGTNQRCGRYSRYLGQKPGL